MERHVADSLSIIPLLPANGCFVDIGSGAGLPGVVIGALRPDGHGHLIEPRRRRASFLAEVTRTVPLPNVSVECARAEESALTTATVDLAVSRALRLTVFLPLAMRFLRIGGVAVAMQTPTQAVDSTAEHHGLQALRTLEYLLPDQSPRRLLLYQRVC